MEDKTKSAEGALKSFHTLWWYLLVAPGVYALLTYFLSGSQGASGGTGNVPDVQWQMLLTLVLVGTSLVSFILSLRFPSEGRLKRIFLQKVENELHKPSAGRVRGTATQPTLLGTLMLGTIFAESISIDGLLLAFLGMSHQSQTMITYGYVLIFIGAIAIAFQRWRADRLVASVLWKSTTKAGRRT
jgi:FtsH-binding integral membrane protein